jgi:hypothetical protein
VAQRQAALTTPRGASTTAPPTGSQMTVLTPSQVLMHLDDNAKTAFQTHHDHFKFLVMVFELTNASSTFQALMNDVLCAYFHKFVLVFFDDILIYNSTLAEHLQHIRFVLLLRQHKLAVKQSRCSFGATSISYLGLLQKCMKRLHT